jgi:hypothetical protein
MTKQPAIMRGIIFSARPGGGRLTVAEHRPRWFVDEGPGTASR